MTERMIITDPKLKEREEKAIEDLRALAPDGVIHGLDAKDKALGKRLSKLYVAIGYKSRQEMVEAFGFTYGETAKGGRPATMDVVQYVDTLQELYGDHESFVTVDSLRMALEEDDPALAKKLKTAMNSATKALGHSFGKELKLRGLIGRPQKQSSDAGDERPANAAGRHMTRVDLIPLLERAITDIKLRQAALANGERPTGIAALIERYPEHTEVLTEARKRGILTVERVKAEGLVKLGELRWRELREQLIARSIRYAGSEELKRIWVSLGLPIQVKRAAAEGMLLPADIVSVDMDKDEEVAECMYSRCCDKPADERVVASDLMSELQESASTCELISSGASADYVFVQVRRRRPRALRSETLAYMLWKAGAFESIDLKLADVWRIRYAEALQG